MSQASKLETLVILRNLLSDPVIGKFSMLLKLSGEDEAEFVNGYAEFCAELFSNTDNLTKYFLEKILEDDNFYLRLIAEKKSCA